MRGSKVRVLQDPIFMIEKYLRPPFQRYLLTPFLSFLPSTLSPLFFTFLGALFGLAAATLVALHFPYLGALFLLLSGFCDVVDGSLARHRTETSPLGAAWDIVTDRLVEGAILFALYLATSKAILVLLMMIAILICITSFLVVGIFSANNSRKSFHYSPGLIERPEAFLLFLLMILFPTSFVPLSLTFTILVLLTASIRMLQFTSQQP